VIGRGLGAAVKQDRPGFDRLDREHPVPRPIVRRKPLPDCFLGSRRDRVQDLTVATEWASKHDEPILDERLHELGVLVPARLLAKVSRPVPWASTFEANGKEHRSTLRHAPGVRSQENAAGWSMANCSVEVVTENI
jgi:hypothetical protein